MKRKLILLNCCIWGWIIMGSSFNVNCLSPASITVGTDSISVYIFLNEDCVISQYYTPKLNQLHQKFASDFIRFVGVFPSFSSKKEKIRLFKEKYKLPFTLKTDYFKTKTKLLGATITPEVVVFNENSKTILYQGRIDNTFFRIGKRRQVTTSSELADALEAIGKGMPISIKAAPAVGCFINQRELSN